MRDRTTSRGTKVIASSRSARRGTPSRDVHDVDARARGERTRDETARRERARERRRRHGAREREETRNTSQRETVVVGVRARARRAVRRRRVRRRRSAVRGDARVDARETTMASARWGARALGYPAGRWRTTAGRESSRTTSSLRTRTIRTHLRRDWRCVVPVCYVRARGGVRNEERGARDGARDRKVLSSAPVDGAFAEGLARVGRDVHVISWRTNKGFSFTLRDDGAVAPIGTFETPLSDGWGLAERLATCTVPRTPRTSCTS